MTRQNWCIVILFLIALGLWRFWASDEQLSTQVEQYYQPDFTADILRSVEYNKDGKITRRIFADAMEHYSELDMTTFTNPVIILYDKDAKSAWKIQAKEGIFNSDDTAILRDDVAIKNMNKNDYVDTITTTYLQLNLKDSTIQSDRLITVKGLLFEQTGVGLSGNLSQEFMTILNQVKATYNNDKKT